MPGIAVAVQGCHLRRNQRGVANAAAAVGSPYLAVDCVRYMLSNLLSISKAVLNCVKYSNCLFDTVLIIMFLAFKSFFFHSGSLSAAVICLMAC